MSIISLGIMLTMFAAGASLAASTRFSRASTATKRVIFFIDWQTAKSPRN